MITARLILHHLEVEDDAAVIRALGGRLTGAHCVAEGFSEAVLERERVYPTGLASEIPVAIPHTVPEYCNRAALAVALLAHPVTFREMGERSREVAVQVVFLPTVTELGSNIAWLGRLTDIIRQPPLLRTMLRSSSASSLARLLKRRLWGMDEEDNQRAHT